MIFLGLGYYYIDSHDIKVENEVESVPYYTQLPDNKGVMFEIGTRNAYFFLDFENSAVTVILNSQNVENMGYNVDYTIGADYSILRDICDYFEGINLTIDAETLRYTGTQVVELLSRDNSDELRIKIIKAIFEKIEKQGTGADFFNMLINSGKTDMKMPDCYFWTDFMDDVAKNVCFL